MTAIHPMKLKALPLPVMCIGGCIWRLTPITLSFLTPPISRWGLKKPASSVVTDLDNYLLPLIRYKVGDVGHYYDGACACGRGFPLMGEIDGRARDVFVLRNGSMVAPARIAAVLQDEPAVTLFQVIQNTEQ